LKRVTLTVHARRYCQSRGFKEEEVEQAIRLAPWAQARQGRMECHYDFEYNALWNGRRYAIKRVRPIFVEESDEIVVITVVTYYIRRAGHEDHL